MQNIILIPKCVNALQTFFKRHAVLATTLPEALEELQGLA
jgi:hypothetical protein